MDFNVGDKVLVLTGANDDHEDLADVVGMPVAKNPGQRGPYIYDDDCGPVIQIKWFGRGDKEIVSCSRCKKIDVHEGRSMRTRTKRESAATNRKDEEDDIVDLTTPCRAEQKNSSVVFNEEHESADKSQASTVDYHPCSFTSLSDSYVSASKREPEEVDYFPCSIVDVSLEPLSTSCANENLGTRAIGMQQKAKDKERLVEYEKKNRKLRTENERQHEELKMFKTENARQKKEICRLRAEKERQDEELRKCRAVSARQNEEHAKQLSVYEQEIKKLREQKKLEIHPQDDNIQRLSHSKMDGMISRADPTPLSNQTNKIWHHDVADDSFDKSSVTRDICGSLNLPDDQTLTQKENTIGNRDYIPGSMCARKPSSSTAQKKSSFLMQKRRNTMSKNMGLVKIQSYQPPIRQAPPLKKRKNTCNK